MAMEVACPWLSRAAGFSGRRALTVVTVVCCLCSCRVSSASRKHTYTVGIFLKPLEEGPRESLLDSARKVSDPSSTSYGHYLTQDELREAAGIQFSQLDSTFPVIQQMFGGINGSLAAHGDLISVSTADWASTYKLGQLLRSKAVGQSLFDMNTGVELVVTPGAPDDFCKNRTNTSKLECEATGPCSWSEDEEWRNCTGDSAGWICWPEQNGTNSTWECVDQYNLHVDEARSLKAGATRQHDGTGTKRGPRSDIWKQRRRGRAWSYLERDAVWSTLSGNATNETGSTKFAVVARSRLLRLLTLPSNISWTSVELTFRQTGTHQSVLIKPADCAQYTNSAVCRVDAVVENLRPIDMMAVCVDFDGVYSTPAGCVCQTNSTLDALGRLCKQLGGHTPQQDPVDFVLPYDFASPAAVREDLGIPAGLTFPDMPSQAVGEFSGETFGMDDLQDAFFSFGLHPSLLNVSVDTPHMYKVRSGNAGEGSLDMQYITALAPGAHTTWIGISDFNMDGFMLPFVVHLNNQSSPPLVNSISWGDAELWFPPAFVERLDYEFAKLALRGVTVLIASGDNGISSSGPSCNFIPDVSLSEWATFVGATMRSQSAAPYCHSRYFGGLGSCEERGPIVCASTAGAIITSSGGFSMYRKRPAYQEAAVSSYLSWMNATAAANISVPCIFPGNCTLGPMMAANRAFPDIAASGHAFPVIIDGMVGMYDGTSASAPAVAAMITLLNAEQSRRGQPPLGALNPWLYQVHAKAPHAFADVTVGHIASNERHQCKAGFSAAPGWDAATGLGVPLFNQLRELLPTRKPQVAAVKAATVARGQALGTAAETERYAESSTHSFMLFMAACGGGALAVAAVAVLVQQAKRWSQKKPACKISSEPLRQALL